MKQKQGAKMSSTEDNKCKMCGRTVHIDEYEHNVSEIREWIEDKICKDCLKKYSS